MGFSIYKHCISLLNTQTNENNLQISTQAHAEALLLNTAQKEQAECPSLSPNLSLEEIGLCIFPTTAWISGS